PKANGEVRHMKSLRFAPVWLALVVALAVVGTAAASSSSSASSWTVAQSPDLSADPDRSGLRLLRLRRDGGLDVGHRRRPRWTVESRCGLEHRHRVRPA